jgi:hypothetical protein
MSIAAGNANKADTQLQTHNHCRTCCNAAPEVLLVSVVVSTNPHTATCSADEPDPAAAAAAGRALCYVFTSWSGAALIQPHVTSWTKASTPSEHAGSIAPTSTPILHILHSLHIWQICSLTSHACNQCSLTAHVHISTSTHR